MFDLEDIVNEHDRLVEMMKYAQFRDEEEFDPEYFIEHGDY